MNSLANRDFFTCVSFWNHFTKDIEIDESEVSGQTAFLTIDVAPANRIVGSKLHESPVNERLKPTKVAIDAHNGTVYHKMELGGDAK